MTKLYFEPNFYVLSQDKPTFTIEELEKEVGVYSATPEFVREYCGPIANSILDRVPQWYYDKAKEKQLYCNCDIRVHRLYPSDYPAYPGWHCDGEFRETYFSQPDMNRIQVHDHLICTVSTHPLGVSNTQFLNQSYCFESDKQDFDLWQEVNNQLRKVQDKRIFDTKDGQLVQFDSWTLHRVMPAQIRGWRLFFRMSMWHKPNLGNGKITKQEQVYKLLGDEGW